MPQFIEVLKLGCTLKITWGAFLKYHPQRFFLVVLSQALGTSSSDKSLGDSDVQPKLEDHCFRSKPAGVLMATVEPSSGTYHCLRRQEKSARSLSHLNSYSHCELGG